ncbi:MAG: AEC family transporter [Rhodobacteraceae bacterium]|nr:AEC family transporter [Paracoccaceae bacterium]
MALIATVAGIVAPVFLLAAVGFGWVRLGFEYRLEFVTRLAMSLAVPCLIFVALMNTQMGREDLSALAVAAALAYGVMSVGVWVLLRLAGLDMRSYLAPLIFGNTGNLGLPLAIFAFGEAGLSPAVVVFSVMAIYNFTAGIWMVSGAGALGKVLREPIAWATLLGGVFLWNGWRTPDWLTSAIELIGQMAIPMMLITLGVSMARLAAPRIGRAVVLSLLKAVLGLGAALAAGLVLGLSGVPLAVLVLQMMTPVAVTSYLLAEKYGADSGAVAGLVVVSTLLSVAILPITIAFLL